jgi:hypothetical protein
VLKIPARPLANWAEQLGVSTKNISGYLDDPIFYTEQAAPNGKEMTGVAWLRGAMPDCS